MLLIVATSFFSFISFLLKLRQLLINMLGILHNKRIIFIDSLLQSSIFHLFLKLMHFSQFFIDLLFLLLQLFFDITHNINVYNDILVMDHVQTLQDVLRKYYDVEDKMSTGSQSEYWREMLEVKGLPAHCQISALHTNENLILEILTYLLHLPYTACSTQILHTSTAYLDPSPRFIQAIIHKLIPYLEADTPCLSTLNVCISMLNSLFHHQTPINSNLDSHIYIYGDEKGIELQSSTRWPFEKGGTLAFWYRMDSQTKDCKIFEIINQDKVGFDILVRNKKIYIQKLEDQTKFRLMKNKSSFLCEALYDEDVKLCIQFEIKKKFFQPYFSINVQMNNFVINGVEIDSFNINAPDFKISMFQNFHGRFYSALALTEKLASQVEQLNNQKGFIYENDIRNFMYIFDMHIKQIFFLFSAIRASTTYGSESKVEEKEVGEEEESKSIPMESKYIPKQTILYDAIKGVRGRGGEKVAVYQNNFIKKQMGNYGGLHTYIPFLDLLQISCSKDELYTSALNFYLEFIKTIFVHKTDSIEQAYQIRFFRILSTFFEKTKMIGFSEETICKLKEIYVALNTRMMREMFIQQVVWGVNFCLYLTHSTLSHYIKFVKTFYNEDIQSSLNVFGITKIINFILDEMDSLDITSSPTPKNYGKILKELFEVIENIFFVKRMDEDLDHIAYEVCLAFARAASPCFMENYINFLEALFAQEPTFRTLFEKIVDQNNECKLALYGALASCGSWKAKSKIISFILSLAGKKFFEDKNKEKEMVTLCSRYPSSEASLRPSSITSQQPESRDSIEYSQDKLSLNSLNINKFVVLNPIKDNTMVLLDELSVIQAISQWAFSEEVMMRGFKEEEGEENPGVFILMELYKGSTYILRRQISKIFLNKIQPGKLTPELMAWCIECLLISEVDIQDTDETLAGLITDTQRNLLHIICSYDIEQTQEENQLSIIKLVYSSVKSKYQPETFKATGNKIFLKISLELFKHFEQRIKSQIQVSHQEFNSTRVYDNCCTFIKEYFIMKGDEDQEDFQEDLLELVQEEAQISVDILQKIFDILVLVTAPNERKIIQQGNAQRNHEILNILFPEDQKQELSFICLVLSALQTIFQCFEDLNITWRKKNLLLIKKYLIYLIQLSENCENAKLDSIQEELRSIFMNTIGFLQNKFHQYFYYPFDRHKNLSFQLQSKIRKNIEELKNTLLSIFIDLIELIKYIEQKGSMQHKSFYELMKPKRRSVQKCGLKNLYPQWWRKADQKVREFIYLGKQKLKGEAQQKLQIHITQKKIALYSSTIQKFVSKKISIFIEEERKQAEAKQKKSVSFYKMVQSEKCKNFSECEEKITIFRLSMSQQEKSNELKRRQQAEKEKKQLNHTLQELWNKNRVFEGYWKNQHFYQFSQNTSMKPDNALKEFYRRVRGEWQTQFGLMPFIKVQAIRYVNHHEHQNLKKDNTYANEIFLEGKGEKKIEKTRKTEKIKIGLQFLKKKMIEKIIKATPTTQHEEIQKYSNHRFLNVLWIQPMMVNVGHLKLSDKTICFCFTNQHEYQHLSLLKNNVNPYETLIKEWKIDDILAFQVKKFMLKQNAVEIFFKNRKSIFISFYGKEEQQFSLFIQEMIKIRKNFLQIEHIPLMLRTVDPIKQWEKTQLTEKWLSHEISNFDYLMCLNIASGRTNCDLNQYPVFPWILSQYSETKFRKGDKKYRDLSKNMGTLGTEQRTKKFQQIHTSILTNHQAQIPIPHNFGFHYSNPAIVLQYLIRINPYTVGAKHLQGGKFDIPDRLFSSLPDSFKNATKEMSDVRELIPEFFYFPEFLINLEEHNFGELQLGGKKVNHVELPDGCMNAFDFIETHREYLQSAEVSENLHKWIDLIFGYKNSGKQAEAATNLFHYLTYESAGNCPSNEEQQIKESLESQINFYGKTPSQLFNKPHPQRSAGGRKEKKVWRDRQYTIFEQESEGVEVMLMKWCEDGKCYMVLRSDGTGLLFELDSTCSLNIIKNFDLRLFVFEEIQMKDHTIPMKEVPMECLSSEQIVVGGLYSGKLLLHNIKTQESECLMKHSSPITALHHHQLYLWSGSTCGELALWACEEKLIYKDKLFLGEAINHISTRPEAAVVTCGTQQGKVWVLTIEGMEVIRVLCFPHSIHNCLVLTFPYYMYFVQSVHQQYCYSLNGQELETGELEGVRFPAHLIKEDTHHEKVALFIGDEVIWMKMPDFTVEARIKVGNKVQAFLPTLTHILIAYQDQLVIWSQTQSKAEITGVGHRWLEMFE